MKKENKRHSNKICPVQRYGDDAWLCRLENDTSLRRWMESFISFVQSVSRTACSGVRLLSFYRVMSVPS